MTLKDGVRLGVMKSTWTLEEAAHYVHNLDPLIEEQNFSRESTQPTSRTYFWLKKEFQNGQIRPESVIDDKPSFIPGTILRQLDAKNKLYHQGVWNFYHANGVTTGPSTVNDVSKFTYRKAACAIWMQYPNLSVTETANLLLTFPSRYPDKTIAPCTHETIRGYLKGLKDAKSGRPKNTKNGDPEIDWDAVLKLV